jgi:hypothetical protein
MLEGSNPRTERHDLDLPCVDIEVERIASDLAMNHTEVVVE